MEKSHFLGDWWFFMWLLQPKHPWKNWIKIWDWQTPPPQLGQNPKFFQKIHLKAPLKGPLFFCKPPLSVTLTGRDYGSIFSQIIVCLLFSPIIICFTKKTNQRLKIKGCTIRLLSNVGYSPYVTLAGHPTPSTSSPGTLTSAHSNPTPLLNEKWQRQRQSAQKTQPT